MSRSGANLLFWSFNNETQPELSTFALQAGKVSSFSRLQFTEPSNDLHRCDKCFLFCWRELLYSPQQPIPFGHSDFSSCFLPFVSQGIQDLPTIGGMRLTFDQPFGFHQPERCTHRLYVLPEDQGDHIQVVLVSIADRLYRRGHL
jgi:hypothetical protein